VIPKQGDIVEIDIPEIGKGKRGQVVIVSKSIYNEKSGLCLVVIILNKEKVIPTEVEIKKNTVILADQIKSVDYTKRNMRITNTIDAKILNKVLFIINKIIF
jgi:mRNA-degrading endonuclease toxin of MazEF toxin-antitoxin module